MAMVAHSGRFGAERQYISVKLKYSLLKFCNRLQAEVENGSVPESRLDDQVVRVLTSYFALGQADVRHAIYAIERLLTSFAETAS